MDPEPRRKHTVARGRHAAALDVAEDCDARLEAGQLLESRGDDARDAAEPLEPERVERRDDARPGRRRRHLRRRRRRSTGGPGPRGRARRPRRSRGRIGCSGTRIASAPAAIPAWVAIHPCVRPITSTTITRSCDSAVVVMRSIASVAICTAVSNPIVASVPAMSLSIDFGTPTTGTPSSTRRARRAQRAVAADYDERVEPLALDRRGDRRATLAVDVWVAPRRAEDRPAALQQAAHRVSVERADAALHQPVPAVEDPDDLGTVLSVRAGDHTADRRVQAGAVATAGEDPDAAHRAILSRLGNAGTARERAVRYEAYRSQTDREGAPRELRPRERAPSGVCPAVAGIERQDSAPAESCWRTSLSTGTSACRRRGAPSAGRPRRRTARRRRRA